MVTRSAPIEMSVLLLSILGVSSGLRQCPVWRDIQPCQCRLEPNSKAPTHVWCEKMSSFGQAIDLLANKFQPQERVSLRLVGSTFSDLSERSFKELNFTIDNLKMNHNYLGELNPDTFEGLSRVAFLSLADNNLEEIPSHLWKKMSGVKTIDMGRTKIKALYNSSFSDLPDLECLVLPGNQISQMERGCIPEQIQRLHLGRNNIYTLNGTLRNLHRLGWLFINSNELTDLEGELPEPAPEWRLLHASHNNIKVLPLQLKKYPKLESIFFQNNYLKVLNGALSKAKNMIRAVLEHNQIEMLAEDDFLECEQLESLLLGHNKISSLNNSIVNLKNLNFLNMTHNLLTQFSFQDVEGLRELRSIDLSFNHIRTITGPAANLVEWNIKLNEIKLDHNEIEALNGAVSGLPELLRLNLSHNKLKNISPDDLIGLDQLRMLDLSHNRLTTLEETSKTFLPRLSELKATHNFLTILERDFHGLPVLCHADLSNNQIMALGRDLVAKTRCKIEHGVHEGTWDTLKINLQDNPILCDAALPEITSLLEINHTRIYGVSHCPPLSEQPTTSKPSHYLGYVPETMTEKMLLQQKVMNEAEESVLEKVTDSPPPAVAVALQKPTLETAEVGDTTTNQTTKVVFDPIQQGQQINKLAYEIEELRTRIDELSSQNQLLLKQQMNMSIALPDSQDKLTELRKP
ncbi:unnamed protein product [Callosobruchus maculatus]|uniref:LRRCT domain-containing protein n=1 Tax=Callosobruchus maculatus TaxID=64391 RepID=A0A653BDN6_CALMS|nr:unnamed protein product [Callosobruchus maculatus]